MIRLIVLFLILALPLQSLSQGAKVVEPSDINIFKKVFKPSQWRKKLFVNGTDSIFVCKGVYRKYPGRDDKECRWVTDDFTDITKKGKELPLKKALLQEYQREVNDLDIENVDEKLIVRFKLGNKVEVVRDDVFFDGVAESSHVELFRKIFPVIVKFVLFGTVVMVAFSFLRGIFVNGSVRLGEPALPPDIERSHSIISQSDPLDINSPDIREIDVEKPRESDSLKTVNSAATGKRRVILD